MLRAPFPWFGGESRAAHLVWPRFGDVPNYIEPFAGGLGVLLARPDEFPPRVETVNDKDAYLSNFWRAVQADPTAVARYCDWPVNEADLHARHRWLVDTALERVERVKREPEYYDPKVAGWWVYGQCLWIGSGWCAGPEWTGRISDGRGRNPEQYDSRPDLTCARGVIKTRNGDTSEQARRPQLTTEGVGVVAIARRLPQKLPQVDRGGRGISGPSILGAPGWQKRPELKRGGGRGVHSNRVRRPNMGGAGGGQGVQAPRLTKEQIPQLSGDGSGAHRGALSVGVQSQGLYTYMAALQARLRRVRVCCGDWARVLTPSVTEYIGTTGILLDPPYSHDERSICYSQDDNVGAAVRVWALEHGDNPRLRIALCGYEGEHNMPASWECVRWKAGGGYGRSKRGKGNRLRERIWFSPHCCRPSATLLSLMEASA